MRKSVRSRELCLLAKPQQIARQARQLRPHNSRLLQNPCQLPKRNSRHRAQLRVQVHLQKTPSFARVVEINSRLRISFAPSVAQNEVEASMIGFGDSSIIDCFPHILIHYTLLIVVTKLKNLYNSTGNGNCFSQAT